MNNIYGRISVVMGFPYEIEDVAAYNKQAENVIITVID
jgi:hypothetical protein